MLADVREPLPAKPGRPRREDYEYQRGGTRNLFLTCEPRRGWRHVAIARQRTMQDFAQQMRWLVDEAYPDVPVIRLVLDNLNTHRMASLYETFPAAEARRIAKRLEFHHTPKHGSWLNMAEIEFSVLARACLRGRNGDEDSLERAVSACVSERNAIGATINWRFTAQDARQTPSPLSLPILIWFSTSIRPIWHCQLVREPRQDATLGIDEGLWDVRWSWCRRSTESGWQHRKRDGSGR